jgi:hypothetical protein
MSGTRYRITDEILAVESGVEGSAVHRIPAGDTVMRLAADEQKLVAVRWKKRVVRVSARDLSYHARQLKPGEL